MSTFTTERTFTSTDLPRLTLPDADGLLVCRWDHHPDGIPTCLDDGGDAAGGRRCAQVRFVVVQAERLAAAALDAVRGADADAAVVHTRTTGPGRSALALAVASHLRTLRRHHPDPAVVTAGDRPDLNDAHDLVRIAHLITVGDATGAVAETAVWEIMTGGQYDTWLAGAPRPDPGAIETHLPGLLRLRALHRNGQLTYVHDGLLLDLLDGVPISARLVHRHPGVLLPAATRAAHRGLGDQNRRSTGASGR
jgi:hypothetical protein